MTGDAKMPEFLYVLKPTRLGMVTTGPTEAEGDVLSQHAAYLSDLAQRRIVQFAGRTQTADEHTMGLVVFRAEDDAAARAVMEADPAIREGVMRATLFPYRIAFRAPA